jgi:hypothetical protein
MTTKQPDAVLLDLADAIDNTPMKAAHRADVMKALAEVAIAINVLRDMSGRLLLVMQGLGVDTTPFWTMGEDDAIAFGKRLRGAMTQGEAERVGITVQPY